MARRAAEIAGRRPYQVARLLDFGFAGELLRLRSARVTGIPLWRLIAARELAPAPALALAGELERALRRWRVEGFVHGDLSPRNILVARERPELAVPWFIDWTVDLSSFAGTPRFAGREVFQGHRSFASDRYAIEEILCILLGLVREHR
ncbi:MAG: hypothetical protein HY075_11420 [Deltaproteobacteria bacterium]|nr:hypothetical protein [Deltaproteobacteria bacterium]